ncbi:MYXO-CTERM sorting domain-containing protein [Haloarchaeobius litoreus]|uniref:MYXO-CTERM sorting domain-containing protein n=1 Tax=Haloarchaeobius litoreus TaxID=755306 RepID=A0ABD6DQX2_9EURY|nr:MYXO-CTERM sorting domain-containing protein [Haloarchaeobius litoreus]
MIPLQSAPDGGVYVALGLLVLLAVLSVRRSEGAHDLGVERLAPLLPLLVAFGALVLYLAVTGLGQ